MNKSRWSYCEEGRKAKLRCK